MKLHKHSASLLDPKGFYQSPPIISWSKFTQFCESVSEGEEEGDRRRREEGKLGKGRELERRGKRERGEEREEGERERKGKEEGGRERKGGRERRGSIS